MAIMNGSTGVDMYGIEPDTLNQRQTEATIKDR
jgi:hypothetical protein